LSFPNKQIYNLFIAATIHLDFNHVKLMFCHAFEVKYLYS